MKEIKLSVVMITKDAEELIGQSLASVQGLADEIVIADDDSTDRTVKIAEEYSATVFSNRESNLGKQKQFAFGKAHGTWVLVLDSDEQVSEELKKEIEDIIAGDKIPVAYKIPFLNHFLGRTVRYGGENYKMLRLFLREKAAIESLPVHEHFEIKDGEIAELKNPIIHYSYRSYRQMFNKFTKYALTEARHRKEKGEKVTLKKLTLYPLHMFYARFIKDKGYKDGLFRIPLDLGFAYMEWLMYVRMLFI